MVAGDRQERSDLVVAAQNPKVKTLPERYYLPDDVQSFPPGTEFRLSHDASAASEHRGPNGITAWFDVNEFEGESLSKIKSE